MSDSNGEFGTSQDVSRRGLLIGGAVMTSGLAAIAASETSAATSQGTPAALRPIPVPAQVPAQQSGAGRHAAGRRHWDPRGEGAPIVLLQPATGSGLISGSHQPAFAKAGHRVIGYSRRGYYNSAPVVPDKRGVGSVDLHNLAEH